MIRILRVCLSVASLAVLTALFTAEKVPSHPARAGADEVRVTQGYRYRTYPRGASYGRGARSMRGGLPGGRSYYNGRYYGNYNNRFYGPQYGYF